MHLWPVTRSWFGCLVAGALLSVSVGELSAQVVPGTGNLLNYDDLEDVNWGYTHNFPKSSKEEDENIRYPLGFSHNRMWSESPKRGSPDTIRRCETPAGGLEGSTGSLYLRTRDSGIPGRPGNKQAQDDFILTARPVGVGYSPNFVVRVFVPEWDAWEQRQGVSFGIRVGLQGMMTKQQEVKGARRFLRGKTETVTELEPYYPGFFVAYFPASANNPEPYAQVLLRSDSIGREITGPKITKTGWWTFGMSVTPDSRCHYYAHHGIENLTAADHLYSSLPYNIRGDHFNTIFFNVCSADNANAWSTPWIIDDPKVYYSGPPVFQKPQQAQAPQPTKTAQAPSTGVPVQSASQTKEVPANTPPTAGAAEAPAVPAPASAPMAAPVLDLPQTKSVEKPSIPMAPPAPLTNAEPIAKPITAPRPVSVPAAPNLPAPAAPTIEPLDAPAATESPELVPPVQAEEVPAPAPAPVEVAAPPATATTTVAPVPPAPVAPVAPLILAMPETEKVEAALREPAPGEPKSEPLQTAQAAPPTAPSIEPPLVAPEVEDESVKVDPAPVPVPPQD